MMAAILMEKDLWDIVDSLLTHPVGSPNHKAVRAFIKRQQLTQAKIILSIKVSQLPHTCHYATVSFICESVMTSLSSHGFETSRELVYSLKLPGSLSFMRTLFWHSQR